MLQDFLRPEVMNFCNNLELLSLASLSSIFQCLWARLELTRVRHLSGMLLVLPTKNILGWKGLPGSNPRFLRKSVNCGRKKLYGTGTSTYSIDIESLQNRLLKVCYVPATSASLPRVSFFFPFLFLLLQPLTVLMKQTR